ncbi:MAG: glycosyltransferase family 1 protein [Bryobacteraceae bacterium]|jgi:glycosyltransferase involved in cell wall biosynthesis
MATIGLDATYALGARPTGTGTYSRRLVESLAALDTPHRFLVCYRLSRWNRRREFLRLPGCPVRLVQWPLTFWLPWQTDLFHSLVQRPPAFRFRREVVTVHDAFPITGRDYSTPEFQRRFSALLREAVARAARVITDSEYTATQLERHCGVESERLSVIPCGVDEPVRTLTPEERLEERDRLVGPGNEMLLSVGNLETRKNVGNALRALALLPERYRLVLAGGDGYGAEAIHAFIAVQALERRIVRLGFVPAERLPALYQSASALLFPSLEEGFGFPVLEAMANGLPVVTSNTSSLPEVGGDAALYVDPLDVAGIAAQAERAVEDQALRRELIEKGRARARQFTWRRAAEAVLRVYEEVLAD